MNIEHCSIAECIICCRLYILLYAADYTYYYMLQIIHIIICCRLYILLYAADCMYYYMLQIIHIII